VQGREQTVLVFLDRVQVHLFSGRQEQRVLQVWDGGRLFQDCAGHLSGQLAGAQRVLLAGSEQV